MSLAVLIDPCSDLFHYFVSYYYVNNNKKMTKDDEDVGEKLQAPPDFDGPTSNRSHTDILCNLLLWCMWISMTGLGIYAVQNGELVAIIIIM